MVSVKPPLLVCSMSGCYQPIWNDRTFPETCNPCAEHCVQDFCGLGCLLGTAAPAVLAQPPGRAGLEGHFLALQDSAPLRCPGDAVEMMGSECSTGTIINISCSALGSALAALL